MNSLHFFSPYSIRTFIRGGGAEASEHFYRFYVCSPFCRPPRRRPPELQMLG